MGSLIPIHQRRAVSEYPTNSALGHCDPVRAGLLEYANYYVQSQQEELEKI